MHSGCQDFVLFAVRSHYKKGLCNYNVTQMIYFQMIFLVAFGEEKNVGKGGVMAEGASRYAGRGLCVANEL